MANSSRSSPNSAGLTAGVGAVICLIICVFVVKLGVIQSAIVAAIALAGLLILFKPEALLIVRAKRPPTVTEKQWFDNCQQFVDAMNGTCQDLARVPKHDQEVAKQLVEICAQSGRILGVIKEDPDKYACAEEFAERLVKLSEWMEGYVRLAKRQLADVEEQMEVVRREVVPNIKYALDRIWNRLHDDDVVSTAAAGRLMEFNLEPLEKPSKKE